MRRIIIIPLLIMFLLSSCVSSPYESPVLHTAKYRVGVGGFWGTAIFTDNYTITNDFVILHGYANKYRDVSSSGDLLIPKKDIDYIEANPDLNK